MPSPTSSLDLDFWSVKRRPSVESGSLHQFSEQTDNYVRDTPFGFSHATQIAFFRQSTASLHFLGQTTTKVYEYRSTYASRKQGKDGCFPTLSITLELGE